MKIGIQTWGSEGDIRPFLALSGGLAAAGHRVTLACSGLEAPEHADIARRLGFTLRWAGTMAVGEAETARLEETVYRHRLPVRQLTTIMDVGYVPLLGEMHAAAGALCAENDLVAGHIVCHTLTCAAERSGTPWVSVAPNPAVVPSALAPPPGLPNLGRGVNRLAWRLLDRLLGHYLLPYYNPLRTRLGLPPFRSILNGAWRSPLLHLVAVSPLFCPPQPDWPGSARVTGFLALSERSLPWEPPPDLSRFLDAGPPPVLMTFGSLMPRDPARERATVALLAEAARRSGCRALVQTSLKDIGPGLPDGVRAVGRVPFDRLMPRCAAVVHHGGSGTTQTATLAGRPQVVVAHIADQAVWGMELRRLGIAPAPLHRRSLTAARLARALRRALDDPAMAARARDAGARLAAEDGVAAAVERISRLGAAP